MRVLDVGCGVGGPAREIVKFAGCHVTGLNINGYQVQRATSYAAKEGLSHKLDFKQGDFMVSFIQCAQISIIPSVVNNTSLTFVLSWRI